MKKDLLILTLFLLGATLYNGFPLVYSDSGTYIFSGFEWKIPADRPIVYGLFIHSTSMGLSLWLPVIVQCLLLAWLIRLLIEPLLEPVYPGNWRSLMYLLTGFLCATGPVSWYAGQLMPDIFTAMQLLIIAIVLIRQDLTLLQKGGLGALFLLCCLVHFSNLFIGLTTLVVMAFWHWRTPMRAVQQYRSKMIMLTVWCASAFLAMPTVNWIIERQFTLGKGGFTFIIGRMIDSGMLKMYLDDQCRSADQPYRLCQYKDSLPDNSRAFHWDMNSPLYKEGGWGVPEAEYRSIVSGTLTSPKFLALHCWKSILATPSQLLQNAVGSGLDYGWYRSPESPPYQAVSKHFPHELNEYNASRQTGNLWKQDLKFDFLNSIHFWILLATLGFVIWSFGWRNQDQLSNVTRIIFTGVVSNALITANLAVICDRFSPRVIWLLALCAGVAWLRSATARRLFNA